MAAEDLVVGAGSALLNGVLALLVLRARPRRMAHGLLAALFAANATLALARGAGGRFTAGVVAQAALLPLESVTIVVLLVVPFVFPRRLLSRRGERALLGAAGALLVAAWATTLLAPDRMLADLSLERILLVHAPAHAGALLGVLILLNAHLTSAPGAPRGPTRLLLAAYYLKLAAIASPLPHLAYAGDPMEGGLLGLLVSLRNPLVWAGILTVPVALAAGRLGRGRGSASVPSPSTGGLVLGAGAAGIVMSQTGIGIDLEYLVLRPTLFAYGILHRDLPDAGPPRATGPLAIVLLAAAGVVLTSVSRQLEGRGLSPSLAVALGVVVALGAAGALSWPLLQSSLAPATAERGERLEIYRAALARAREAVGPHAAATNPILSELRSRLGVTEREHALLLASSAQGPGAPVAGEPAPRLLGRYRLERAIVAEGPMREHLAFDERMARPVVVRVVQGANASRAERVRAEARRLAGLVHPNVVLVHDVETVGDDALVVFEHVEGPRLDEVLRDGPLPLGRALQIADDVLGGLEAMHSAGVIHAGLSPACVVVAPGGRARLTYPLADRMTPTDDGTLTSSSFGAFGSDRLRHAAPEQLRGGGGNARSDVHAAGVLLYEMVAGRSPFGLENLPAYEIPAAILEDPPDLPIPGTPDALNALLACALAKDVLQRPPSPAAMRAALAQIAGSVGRGKDP